MVLDVGCGDFLIRGAEGVDSHTAKIGPTYYLVQADELVYHDQSELDFIVCNYFDAFPNVLKTLNEWNRVLKPKGLLAIIVRDSSQYPELAGPLENKHRVNVFTKDTIKHYLYRAKFEEVTVDYGDEKSLRVKGRKSA